MKNLTLIIFAIILLFGATTGFPLEFPNEQPKNGNFNRPLPDQVLDISPPGFCWWRCAPRGEINYRLHIESASGNMTYQSELLSDPVHIPDRILPAGKYSISSDSVSSLRS